MAAWIFHFYSNLQELNDYISDACPQSREKVCKNMLRFFSTGTGLADIPNVGSMKSTLKGFRAFSRNPISVCRLM